MNDSTNNTDTSSNGGSHANKDSDYSDFMFWRNLVPLFDKSVQTPPTSKSGESNEDEHDENEMESSTTSSKSTLSGVSASSQENETGASNSTQPTLSNFLNKNTSATTSQSLSSSSSLLETTAHLNRVTIYSSTNNLATPSSNNQFAHLNSSSFASTIEQLSNELKQVLKFWMSLDHKIHILRKTFIL